MTIFKYTKDGLLYTIVENRHDCYGKVVAHPYNRDGASFEIKGRAMRDRFIPVGER